LITFWSIEIPSTDETDQRTIIIIIGSTALCGPCLPRTNYNSSLKFPKFMSIKVKKVLFYAPVNNIKHLNPFILAPWLLLRPYEHSMRNGSEVKWKEFFYLW